MPYRIGVAGCGYWGIKLISSLFKIDNVILEAVADPDPGARYRGASLLGGNVKTHATFDYLLSDRVDGVVIASPPAVHVEQAVAALDCGKDVFVEKPAVMNLHDLDRLLGTAAGKLLVCDYVFLYNPLIRWIEHYMHLSNFELIHANAEWLNRGIVRSDVSCWWSAGSHALSVFVYLFGDVQTERIRECEPVLGMRAPYAIGHFKINGDGFGVVSVSWAHPIKTRKIDFVGRNETILFDDIKKEVWVVEHGGEAISSPSIEYKPEPLVAALTDFVECAKTGREPVAGPKIVDKVTRLMLNSV